MSRPRPRILSFPNPETLAGSLAAAVAERLRNALAEDKTVSLVVSGGTTPKRFFRRLSEYDLAWDRVLITLADERWVDPASKASNEYLVQSQLLRSRARAATFVPLKNSAPSARQGENECHLALSRLPRPFAAVILGMGGDGHTASLFPGAAGLAEALDMHSGRNCAAVSPAHAPHERMTLTLPLLLDAGLIILHITGAAKRRVLAQAMEGRPSVSMPIRAVLDQGKTPVHIYWAP
ncbi:MAG TPA: 6-phosphogluconolactonase [Desulfobacteraceae bacterium]|nr:6-phosphogluconolactonase [Desulfobacteraceae bacterium]